MIKKSFYLTFVIVLVMAVTLTGCNSSSNGTDPATNPNADKEYGVFRITSSTKYTNINPHQGSETVVREVHPSLYEYIPNADYTTVQIMPCLADGMPKQLDDDGKLWEIKIKSLKWANGDDLDANDVVYSWKTILDPNLLLKRASQFYKRFIEIDNAAAYYKQKANGVTIDWSEVGIKLVDNNTINIRTIDSATPFDVASQFEYYPSRIVNETIYEPTINADRTETTYGTSVETTMSAGRFILTDWVVDSVIKMKKNPDYVFADYIKMAGYEIHKANQSTALQLFKNGEVDYISLTGDDIQNYEEDPYLLKRPLKGIQYVTVNTVNPDQPILANSNFRNALFYAMDRVGLAKVVRGNPANFFMSERMIIDVENNVRFRDTDVAKKNVEPNYSYDPEKAKQLFDKAMQEEGLDKVKLSMVYSETSSAQKIQSELLQQQLPKIFGEDKFELELKAMPSSARYNLIRSFKENPTGSELSWGGWNGEEFMPWLAMVYFTSDYPLKDSPMFSDEFDQLYKEAATGETRAEEGVRLNAVARMEQILLEDKSMIPIYQSVSHYIHNERVEKTFGYLPRLYEAKHLTTVYK